MTHSSGRDDPPTHLGGRPMFGALDPDAHVIDLATQEWCWGRLLTTTEGVLSSRGAKRPASVAVSYTMDGAQVLIPIESFAATAGLLAGGDATLGLTGHDDDGLRWVVRATGLAVLSVRGVDSLTASRSSHPARSLAPPPGVDALLLTVDRLRGYFETPLRTLG